MPRNHPAYEQGYAEGYNAGYNRALGSQIGAAQKSSQPAVTITAPIEVVDAARSSLAIKVLEVVENMEMSVGRLGARKGTETNGWYWGQQNALTALRDLFHREGIEL